MAKKYIGQEQTFSFKKNRKSYVGIVIECSTMWEVTIRKGRDFICYEVNVKKTIAKSAQEALDVVIEKLCSCRTI